jgi:hypothetical protein
LDLTLYARVLWRFRYLAAVGIVVACALAFLAVAKVSYSGGSVHVQYRKAQVFQSSATLLVTQSGFPWGRAIYPYSSAGAATLVSPFADPGRLSGLAVIYARFAGSDDVRRLMLKEGPMPGAVTANVFTSGDASNAPALPLIAVTGIASTPRNAVVAATRATSALIKYIDQQQQQAKITPTQRVELQVLSAPNGAILVVPRRKTLPIAIFILVLTMFTGLIFALENIRPKVRLVEPAAARDSAKARSA